jgi:hypothetical protein
MTMSARFIAVAGVLALAVAGAGAQNPDPVGAADGRIGLLLQGPIDDPGQLPPFPGGRFGGPMRDNAAPPQGTAKISGRVVAADTGTPIRRAQVRINAPEARTNRVATTDNQGRYEIAGLPAARYRLQISKAGYVTLEYGQARPFEAGKPLDIADRQTLEKIDFSLPRGSVITGRIADEFGDPVADAQVQAMRYQFLNGERRLVNAGRTSTTDDIGQYRVFGLMPGEYIVRASVRNNNAMSAALAVAEDPSGYPATYYPGTSDVAQAQAVTVALGQELSSVAFSLVPARLALISGNVLGSDGQPLAGGVVVLRSLSGGGGGGAFSIGGGNQVRADGSFTLNNVPPGEYMLDVQQRPRNMQNLAGAQLEFASIPMSVAGVDISGLTILTTPGVSVSGRIVFEGQAAKNVSARGVQVSAIAPRGMPSIMGMAGRALGGGRVNNNEGTFELRALLGPLMIRVGGVPTGWAVKTISLEGEDITDTPFDFKAGSNLTGLVVTLTDRLTALAGAVRDTRGQVVKDYTVVIFPEDAKLWDGQSRYVRTARPDQDGNFAIKGLPPARYFAAALESLETGMQNDPALLEQLRPRAKSFALTEGQSLTLSLEMSPGQ